MIKPAALICQPIHLDFPIFRYNMERFQKYFSSIWIALSNHYVVNQDLGNFERANLPFANFVEFERTRPDWRDDAVNNLLEKVPNEKYVLFLEQDFLIRDDSFFEKVFKDDVGFAYYKEDQRIHPAFALVKRELVDKTSKDFSATPPGDHFYRFFQELPGGIDIEHLGVKNREDYVHLAGLSQNYQNFKYDDPFYKPNNFLVYNRLSMALPVPKHPLFSQIEQQIENHYGHPPKHSFLTNFFPNTEDVL